jgi:hypothetical protein
VEEVLGSPGTRVVDTAKVVVVDDGILALEDLRGRRQPLEDASPRSSLARRKRTIREPPEKDETQDNCDKTVDEEHPSETDKTTTAVHKLEARRHKANHGGRDLSGSKVHADSLSGSRRRIEESEVESHAGPHACNDSSEQESKKLDAPGILDSSEAGTDDASSEDNTGHPETGAELAHDQVGGEVEDDIGDIEQSESSRSILRSQPKHSHEVMTFILVHGLSNSNVGSDGRTEEVEDPKSCESDEHIILSILKMWTNQE